MATTLTATQKITCGYAATDAKNNPTTVENPKWTTSDEALLPIEVSADGATVVAKAGTGTGAAQLNFEGDAKMGEGEKLLRGVLDIEVVAGEALNVTITPGTPEEQEGGGGVTPPTEPTPTGRRR